MLFRSSLIGKKGLFWIVISVVLSLILALLEYCIAVAIQILIYSFGLTKEHHLPGIVSQYVEYINSNTAIYILLSVSLIRFVSQFLNNLSPSVLNELVNARMRILRVYDILLSANKEKPSSAELLSHISEIFPKAGAFLFHTTRVVSIGLQVGVIFVVMVLTAWKESLLSGCLLFFLALIMYVLQAKVKEKAGHVPRLNKQMMDDISQVLRNWVFIKISRTENRMSHRLYESIFMYFDKVVKTAIFNHATAAVAPFAGSISICMIIFASQTYFATQASSLLIFLYLFVRFNQQLTVLSQSIGVANSVYPHFKEVSSFVKKFSIEDVRGELKIADRLDVFPTINMEKIINEPKKISHEEYYCDISPPRLKLNNISYAWDKKVKIFEDFSIDVKPGEQLAIVGRSGSGKSTLLSLILGLIDPIVGAVRIDNMSPNEYLKKFGSRIAYAGVDPYLTSGSIRENIIFGMESQISEDEINQAVKASALAEDISSMQGGLDYKLSEGGDGLSAGQKQRISFARAILRKPKILILDEATANLDTDTEKSIIQSVKKLHGKCTVVMVSHKKESIKYADKKIVLSSRKDLPTRYSNKF